jgi:hypothetical protein
MFDSILHRNAPTINRWSFAIDSNGNQVLHGILQDGPKTDQCTTSAIVKIDFLTRLVFTVNSVYKLGEPHTEFVQIMSSELRRNSSID